jgi:type IX secretion system PorP/SprF family membrane protein
MDKIMDIKTWKNTPFFDVTIWVQKKILLIILVIWTSILMAQDPHFSQFYASPLTLNPAIAGTYSGTFRISTIYRDQWRSALDNPLRTFALSGDVKFDVSTTNRSNPDIVAVGITFFGDRVSTFDFNTNQVLLTVAYHKSLNKRNKQYLGIGFQGGIFQKAINYENLSFQDQFNSLDQFNLPTAESLPPNNNAFADFNAGLYYSVTPSKKFNFHAGMGYFHFNQPNVSFFNTTDIINPNVIKLDTLRAKWSLHTGASIKTSDRMYIQPRVNALIQGPHAEVNFGATFRYKLSKTAGKYLLLGPYIRGVKNYDKFGMESIIGMVGFEMNDFILGFSYDQNLSSLFKDRRSLSSLEISIVYIGEHHNEDNFCPQF